MTSDEIKCVAPGIIPPSAQSQAVLIDFDETEIHWCPDTGWGYQIVAQQNRIASPGIDADLLGGVVYPSGEGLYQIFDRKRTMEVESYLVSLCEMFGDQFIFLVWDNAKTHTTEMLQPFFSAFDDQIFPVFLPTYSPGLNLIERLWRQMRAEVTQDTFFATVGQTCQAVIDWLGDLSFDRFLSLMGLDPFAFVPE